MSSVISACAIAHARARPLHVKGKTSPAAGWRGITAPPSLIFPARRTVYVYLHKMASRRNF